VVDEPEHGEGHGDEADGEVAESQVDDQQVLGGAGLRVPHDGPTNAEVGNHSGNDQKTGKKMLIR
jgi:hypothetical protein